MSVRLRAIAVLSVLVLVVVGVWVAVSLRTPQPLPPASEECKSGLVLANTTLPIPEQVKLRVYNATGTPGRALAVSRDLTYRKFKVLRTGTYTSKKNKVEGVAVLRYGPKAVGAAWLMRAYFLNGAKAEFNIKRTDDVVDVLLGPKFQQLATTTEVNQAIAALGKPQLPPGTCAIER